MRLITSSNAFKTCYIAEVKEELGILKIKRKKKRKHSTPLHLKPFIKKAIEKLGNKATYKEIQEEALRLYQEEMFKEVDQFFGMFKPKDGEFVREIAESKEIYYGEIE